MCSCLLTKFHLNARTRTVKEYEKNVLAFDDDNLCLVCVCVYVIQYNDNNENNNNIIISRHLKARRARARQILNFRKSHSVFVLYARLRFIFEYITPKLQKTVTNKLATTLDYQETIE